MNLKKELRNRLIEAKKIDRKREYGCLMVYLDVPQWKEILKSIKEEDLYIYIDEEDPTFGREGTPHVTVLFGFHEEVKDKEIEEELKEFGKPKLKIKNISAFNTPKYDVLKFDVESKDLHDMNETFKKFPHTNTFPNYHPHCTIAYLKVGKADEYIKKMKDKVGISFESKNFVYSKVDNTEKTYDFKKIKEAK